MPEAPELSQPPFVPPTRVASEPPTGDLLTVAAPVIYGDVSESQARLLNAIAEGSAGFDAIGKTRDAAGGRFKYSTLSEINRAIRPELAKAGVTIMQPLVPSPLGLPYTRILTILGGHGATMTFPYDVHLSKMAEGANVPTQAQKMGTALTYMRRYLLCAALNLEGERDLDEIAEAGGGKPAKNPAPPVAKGQRRETRNAPPPGRPPQARNPTTPPLVAIPAAQRPVATDHAPTPAAPVESLAVTPKDSHPADGERADFPEDAFTAPPVLEITSEQRKSIKSLLKTSKLTKLSDINEFIARHVPGKEAATIDSSEADVVIGALRKGLGK